MTKRGVICVLALVLTPLVWPVATAAWSSQADELASVPRISQAAFKKALASGAIRVIDVRDAASYASGHIPGAHSIPLDQLSRHLPELKAARRPIVTYCA